MIKRILNNKLLILISAVLILIVGFFVVFANITISPNKEYMAWYNRISKCVTLEKTTTLTKWHFGNSESPSFLWSPNSEFLAMTFSEANGNRFSEIMDIEHSYNILVPTQSYIQTFNEETQTINKNKNAKVEITKWLDNKHVLVEFSWPSDKPGKTIAGWFNFEFSTYSIKQFNIAED